MFYYPNVLHRHGGCFSTIWLAATRGIRVTRRELLKVNVKRTCNDIVDYVTAQVPPPQPNVPKPRFSLYLSSQLQYGVVVVYHRQCSFLLDEVQQTIDRLLRSNRCTRINMECDRLPLDLPDRLYLMQEAEGAQDPFFGLMQPHQLLSPYKIQRPLVVEEEASRRPLVAGRHTAPVKEGFRSPPAAITLTEEEQLHIDAAERFEGDELAEATAREIDLLMDQPDQFRPEEDRSRGPEGGVSCIEPLLETVLGAERDTLWLLDEETGLPVEVPMAAAADLEMTPVRVAMPTPPSGASGKDGDAAAESVYEEVNARPHRKPAAGRRRQLVFADPEVQISDAAMKQQIRKPLAETLELADLLLAPPSSSPAQLFGAPCGPLLHGDLLLLWTQCASLTALPGPRGEGEEEEQDREILRTERKRRRSGMREMSSESGLQPTDVSSASKEDRSLSDVVTPVSRWSPQEEVLLPMEPIVEENVEMPDAHMGGETEDMLSWISCSLQKWGEVAFVSLLPPEASRGAAAHALYRLLELLSAGQLSVRQLRPYGDIAMTTAASCARLS